MKKQGKLACSVIALVFIASLVKSENSETQSLHLRPSQADTFFDHRSTNWVQDNLPQCVSYLSLGLTATKDCMFNNGYLSAEIITSTPPSSLLATINPGNRSRVQNIQTASDTPHVKAEVLQAISGVFQGDYLNLIAATNLAKNLEQHRILENVQLDFYPVSDESLDIIIHGSRPTNALQLGLFMQASGSIGVGLNGQHYSDLFAPGPALYSLSVDGLEKTYVGSLLLPVAYRQTSSDQLALKLFFEPNAASANKGFQTSYSRQYSNTKNYAKDSTKEIFASFTRSQHVANSQIDTYLSFGAKRESTILKPLKFDFSESYSLINTIAYGSVVQIEFGASDRNVPLMSNEIGFNWSLKAGTQLGKIGNTPIRERFYLGGAGSVRGIDFAQIGSADKIQQILGGSGYLSGQFEIEKLINTTLETERSLGLHLDFGALFASGARSPLYISNGFFYRQELIGNNQVTLSVSNLMRPHRERGKISLALTSKF